MGLMPDWMIDHCVVIDPFVHDQCRKGVISYGLTSYGYDARLGRKFKVCIDPVHAGSEIIDPKRLAHDLVFYDHEGDHCIIPPHGFILGETVEYFEIPRGVLGVCLGKSTYARCGIIVNVTPLEPEWKGVVTIEISNTTPYPVKVYANEGIMQVLFVKGDGWCEVSYADKKGKYQDQKGLTLPIVEG